MRELECEWLDGSPDGWTQYGASGKEMSSNARIKALGNNIAVLCAERVFIGILAVEKEVREDGWKAGVVQTGHNYIVPS